MATWLRVTPPPSSSLDVGPVVARYSRDSPYSSTQFLSFSINTMGGRAAYGECEGRAVDSDGYCYIGNDSDLEEDVMHRYAVLEEVLMALREDNLDQFPEIDFKPSVLKIFMLPEFYWRGPNGAYSTGDISSEDGILVKLMDRLRAAASHEDFKDFLFVFGTLILTSTSDEAEAEAWERAHLENGQQLRKDEVVYFNLAIVMRGGPLLRDGDGNADGNYFLVPKKYISTADFLNRAEGLPDPRSSHVMEYGVTQDKQMVQFLTDVRKVRIVPDGLLNIDGVRIGVEICLDHRLSVLWKNLLKETPEGDDVDLLDILLVTSAGMAIERGPSPVRTGGVSYLTDGEGSSAACRRTDIGPFDPDVVCRDRDNDGPMGLRHIPVGGQKYSSYIEISACLNPEDTATSWKTLIEGYFSTHATQGCAFTLQMHGIDVYDEERFEDPSVDIYPTIDLP